MSNDQGPQQPAGASKDAIAPGTAPPATPPASPGAITAEPMNVPPIALTPPAVKPVSAESAKKEPEHKDTARELIETIVFVVVLVLMLKTFLAEAFVIPTGSMADTLLGYQHNVTCKQCGKPNLANASSEADPQGGPVQPVVEWQCENCRFWNKIP